MDPIVIIAETISKYGDKQYKHVLLRFKCGDLKRTDEQIAHAHKQDNRICYYPVQFAKYLKENHALSAWVGVVLAVIKHEEEHKKQKIDLVCADKHDLEGFTWESALRTLKIEAEKTEIDDIAYLHAISYCQRRISNHDY